MKRVHEELPNASFAIPEGLVQTQICSKSGKLPTPGLCEAAGSVRTEYFAEGTEPIELCDIHHQGRICAYSGLIAAPECPFAYDGITTLSLPEHPALLNGSTSIVDNEDGTQTVVTPKTSNICPHDALFFANPDYETILNQHQWEMNQRNSGNDD